VSRAIWRKKCLAMIASLCALAAMSLTCGSQPRDIREIRHTIFIIKENRTFDHYFGLLQVLTVRPQVKSQAGEPSL